jgi:hypothetical protein
MADRFDQEFYSTEWRRVLPLGPDGIQPYIRTSRTSRRPGLQAVLGRLIATLGATAQGVIAFGRLAAIGMARRPMPVAAGARAERQRPLLRLAHEAAPPAPRRAAATRRRSRAA